MSALSIPSVGLSTGYQIPQFGFGTYKIAPEDCVDAVKYALDLGIRHIDTAQMYHNEAEVGRAIEESGIPRDEIFLTSPRMPGNLSSRAWKIYAPTMWIYF